MQIKYKCLFCGVIGIYSPRSEQPNQRKHTYCLNCHHHIEIKDKKVLTLSKKTKKKRSETPQTTHKSTTQKKAEKRKRQHLKYLHDPLEKTHIKNLIPDHPADLTLPGGTTKDDFFRVHSLSFKIELSKHPKNLECERTWAGKYWKEILQLPTSTIIITRNTLMIYLHQEFCAMTEQSTFNAAKEYITRLILPYLKRLGFRFKPESELVKFGLHHTVLPKALTPQSMRHLGKGRNVIEGNAIFIIDDSKGNGGEVETFGDTLRDFFNDIDKMKKDITELKKKPRENHE